MEEKAENGSKVRLSKYNMDGNNFPYKFGEFKFEKENKWKISNGLMELSRLTSLEEIPKI